MNVASIKEILTKIYESQYFIMMVPIFVSMLLKWFRNNSQMKYDLKNALDFSNDLIISAIIILINKKITSVIVVLFILVCMIWLKILSLKGWKTKGYHGNETYELGMII